MIFVTVGTHEQPFDRLIKEIDRLKGDNKISDEVIIQKGYSLYQPKYCKYFDFLEWNEMQKYNKEARIVITHGGPASFIDILSLGKRPIIVPRQKKFNEHVNDHQLEFAKELKKRGENIVVVEDISELLNALENNESDATEFISNNKKFNEELMNNIKKLYD